MVCSSNGFSVMKKDEPQKDKGQPSSSWPCENKISRTWINCLVTLHVKVITTLPDRLGRNCTLRLHATIIQPNLLLLNGAILNSIFISLDKLRSFFFVQFSFWFERKGFNEVFFFWKLKNDWYDKIFNGRIVFSDSNCQFSSMKHFFVRLFSNRISVISGVHYERAFWT